ncbi:nectin-1-like [Callorhinchus milii]|uniref:nectin-1-like n=1 Tax=Callorhinchus milii TaxID=7868 RepID=UPI001C3FBA82|nr:nectin-1-like [Callorhinchus milii]
MLVSALILCLITSSTGAAPQRVEVMDRVTAIAGQDVTLPCTLREVGASSSVTQVTWVKDPEGQGLNLAVFSPSLGTSHPLGGAEGGGGHGRWGLRSPSPSSVPLTINSVRLEDEGKYSCEYSLFPQGKNGGQTSLTVWVEPLVSVSRLPVWAGDSRSPVAECSASNGKPGAEITWVSDFPGNTSTRETRNPNGTQSLTSRYFLVPTHNQHNRLITCSVTHPTLTRPVTIPVRLTVSYSPIVSIKKLEGNSSVVLHCLADGNPTPSVFTWSV